MASGDNFCRDLTRTLEEKGVLDKLTCELRVEVIKLLKEEKILHDKKLNPENFVINELIKEYLEWNGLKNTIHVLNVESGHPKEHVSREELETSLNVKTGERSKKVPLLYTLVSSLRK